MNALTRWSTALDHLRDLVVAGFSEISHYNWISHLNENFRRMRSQIDGNRNRLLAEGVPAALLEKFSASLERRIAWPDGYALEWGAFVCVNKG